MSPDRFRCESIACWIHFLEAPAVPLFLGLVRIVSAVFCPSAFNYRYGGHIEFIRFKEYYGMPRGQEHDPIYLLSVCTRAFWANFSLSFP